MGRPLQWCFSDNFHCHLQFVLQSTSCVGFLAADWGTSLGRSGQHLCSQGGDWRSGAERESGEVALVSRPETVSSPQHNCMCVRVSYGFYSDVIYLGEKFPILVVRYMANHSAPEQWPEKKKLLHPKSIPMSQCYYCTLKFNNFEMFRKKLFEIKPQTGGVNA